MKKIYKTPVSKVYNITNQHIIANSDPTIPVVNETADGSYIGGGDVNAYQSISNGLWDNEW